MNKIGCASGEKISKLILFSARLVIALLWLTPKIGCASGKKISKLILFSARLALSLPNKESHDIGKSSYESIGSISKREYKHIGYL